MSKYLNCINSKGFLEIENFLNDSELNYLRSFVDQNLSENNNQYFFLTSNNKNKTLLSDKIFFKKFDEILKEITKEFNFQIREDEDSYRVLRVVTGEKSKKVSLDYHFDAHLLTLLIPIYIPNRENSNNGNLVIFKNLRKLTKNLFLNLIQKIFYQSFIFKKIFINTGLVKGEILNLRPKNIYIFNGFRTLHTNLEIDPKDVRATLLVHYHDIFKNSFLIRKNRELRIKREQNNIARNKSI